MLKSQGGEGLISTLYTMLLLTIIFFIGIDIAGYTATGWKLRNACTEALTLMKMENGFNNEIEQRFLDYAIVQGLSPSEVAVWGTPQKVQRGDPVTIRAVTPYVVKSLRPFNREIRLEIVVEISGLAQEFVR